MLSPNDEKSMTFSSKLKKLKEVSKSSDENLPQLELEEHFHPSNTNWSLNLFTRSPFFWVTTAFCLLLVVREISHHISLQRNPHEIHSKYKPPTVISSLKIDNLDSIIENSSLIQYSTGDETLPQYEKVLFNDQLWEQMANLYLPNDGNCAVDCSFDIFNLATCRCFETLADLYRRTLRMLPKSGILSIDFDILPDNESTSLFVDDNIVVQDAQASVQDISLPYLPLYTTAMGHRSIVFTNSKKRGNALEKIAKNHRLEDHLRIYSNQNDYLNLDQLSQDWALLMRISANGKEEIVVQGAKDFIANRTVTYLILRFWPHGITANGGSPSRLLNTFLNLDYKISLLGVGKRILKDRIHQKPWKVNDMITHSAVVPFVESLEDSFAYLYLTRGGDVAIPDHMTYKSFNPKKSNTEYTSCKIKGSKSVSVTLKNSELKIACHGTAPYFAHYITSFETGNSAQYKGPVKIDSEYVCAKVQCTPGSSIIEKCAIQNIPKQELVERKESSNPKKPNILVLLVDALSKANFLHFLPKTAQTLNQYSKQHDFQVFNFTDYHVVGTNSGPNQAALFAGELVGGGDTSLKNKTADQEWIWKILKEQYGYTTLKIEDMCFKHSGLLKALGYLDKTADPPTTHAFLEFFCPPNYRRPHCIGDKSLSTYMFDYLRSFMSNYQDKTPWAAFANFGEAHEDSVSLSGILDNDLNSFIENLNNFENTVTILVSDHGLHYGPYFQTKTGQQQHMSPFVYMFMPNNVLSTFSDLQVESLNRNQHMPTTPLNIYHTVRDLIDGQVSAPEMEARTSLFYPIRENIECSNMGVPEKYCRRTIIHQKEIVPTQPSECRVAKHYPSYRTFTMDQDEPYHSISDSCVSLHTGTVAVWNKNQILMNCSKLETGIFWTKPNDDNVRYYLKEYHEGPVSISKDTEVLYSVCTNKLFPEQTRSSVQIRNIRKTKVAMASVRVLQEIFQKPPIPFQLPDIYMINVDSASRSESLRGLKYTLANFKQLNQGGEYSYFDFSLYNTVGFNTIPNQVAALSGCVARDLKGNSLFINSHVSPSLVYELPTPASSIYQFLCSKNQLQLPENSEKDVWLFDYLRNRGYVSLWGKDTCPGQGFNLRNFFKKKTHLTDHTSGSFNCEKTNENFKKNSFCVAGKYAHSYSLDYLEQFNNNYRGLPKFALIDLMAAEQSKIYDNVGSTKALDRDLEKTLSKLTNSTGSKIIFLMSYHGLNHGFAVDSNSGQLEHKLPMLHVLVSNQLLEKYNAFENFKDNSQTLVTPYDIYATIRHLIELETQKETQKSSSSDNLNNQRSLEIPSWSHSFFEKIPKIRTCNDALIPENYCACDYAESSWGCSYDNNAPGCNCNKKDCPLRPTSYVLAERWEKQ